VTAAAHLSVVSGNVGGQGPVATRRRRLHAGHFAFMRAVVQGVEPQLAWDRYLRAEGQASDLRLVRSTVVWIRDEFAVACRREHRPGTARLVVLDASKIPAPVENLPDLQAYAIDQGLEDESESVQIAAYEAAFGKASQRLRRRGRLIDRQLQALQWLERLVAEPPRAGDSVASWLHPQLADRLEAAEIWTLHLLAERINGLGKTWYSGIRGLGAAKAQRVLDWLKEHEATTGLRVGKHVAQRRTQLYRHELDAVVAPATDIRPLEKFVVPAELDGRAGLYRRPQSQCLLSARNDYEAVIAWLRAKHGMTPAELAEQAARRRHRATGVEREEDWLQSLSHTQRAYRKEAERFLLWAIVERHKPLSSMSHEDCVAYRAFIADPTPARRWCAPRSRQRWSPLWRPFEGPLSTSAQRYAVTVLKNLYGFLVDQNYLMGNPWTAIGTPRHAGPKLNTGRSFNFDQWAFVQRQASGLPDTSANARLRLALNLLYATGLRLSEVVRAKTDDLVWVELSGPAAFDARAHEAGQGAGQTSAGDKPKGRTRAAAVSAAGSHDDDQVVRSRRADLAKGGDADESVQGWMLEVLGKGQRLREVPVPLEVVAQLADYLTSRGLDADPEAISNRGVHLLGQAIDLVEPDGDVGASRRRRVVAKRDATPPDPKAGIAEETLYGQLKTFFGDCADVLRHLGDVKGAERLDAASTHWLRHTHATHAIAAGMPIEIAQQNLGHASLATTTAYVTSEKRRRMAAVNAFWSKTHPG